MPALSLCVNAFTQPGDGVVVQTPVYYPFFHAIERNGRRLIRNPLVADGGRYRMDLDDLERRIDERTRLLILCSPHNPVGRVWTREELEALGEVCVRRDLIVLSDEIHMDLVLAGHRARAARDGVAGDRRADGHAARAEQDVQRRQPEHVARRGEQP